MRLAPVIDLTSYHSRRYTSVVGQCSCSPGLKSNGWENTYDPRCCKVHAWVVGLAPGFYPWSPFGE